MKIDKIDRILYQVSGVNPLFVNPREIMWAKRALYKAVVKLRTDTLGHCGSVYGVDEEISIDFLKLKVLFGIKEKKKRAQCL